MVGKKGGHGGVVLSNSQEVWEIRRETHELIEIADAKPCQPPES